MANKNQKANDAILMALLQDLKGNSAASTAAIAMANIKRDGADQGDIHEIAVDDILDNAKDPISKIKFHFGQHPEIEQDLLEFAESNNIPKTGNVVQDLINIIQARLANKGYEKFAEGGQFETSDTWIEVQIGKKTYNLLVASTEEQKEKGLMGVVEMDSNEGMLFDYSDDPQPEISFWMKDTEIPLDIIFVNQDGVVISVKHGEPLSEEYITEDSEFVSCVIELNANSGVKAGDKTDLFAELNNTETEESEEDEIDEHPELGVNRLYVYGSDGNVQAELQGGERIFSRKSSAVIIRKAKKAYVSKEDKDYKALGRYIFNEMDAQDNRKPEYVET